MIKLTSNRSLLRVVLLTAAICISALTSPAQTIDMTKIVYRLAGPEIKPDSPDAQPRTVYRAQDKYLRIEEPPNPAKKMHMLKITREPDAWAINLMDHTAQHLLDPGPTFNVRAPIIWVQRPPDEPDPDRQFMALEFGNEEAFFRQNQARELEPRKIDGKECKALAIKTDTRELTLLLDPETGKPVQIEGTKGGKPDFVLRYVSYETNLPFDPSLFEPPEGLKITEAK